jgi:hypothetical protein
MHRASLALTGRCYGALEAIVFPFGGLYSAPSKKRCSNSFSSVLISTLFLGVVKEYSPILVYLKKGFTATLEFAEHLQQKALFRERLYKIVVTEILKKRKNCFLVPVLKLFVDLTITLLDVFRRPFFYLKDVSETILSLYIGGTYSVAPNR